MEVSLTLDIHYVKQAHCFLRHVSSLDFRLINFLVNLEYVRPVEKISFSYRSEVGYANCKRKFAKQLTIDALGLQRDCFKSHIDNWSHHKRGYHFIDSLGLLKPINLVASDIVIFV